MKMNVKKLAVSAMLVALTVSLSNFAIPIGASKCFPIQHLANVVTDVFLGPGYSAAMIFCTSLIRNLMGTGGFLAFPGSMIGALVHGLAYRYPGKLILAYTGKVFGTGIAGGILCYPMAAMVMGKEAAIFAYVVPSLMSTPYDTVIAAFLVEVLCKSGTFEYMKHLLDTDVQPSKAVGKQIPVEIRTPMEKQITVKIQIPVRKWIRRHDT